MIRKCHVSSLEGAELAALHSNVWSIRPAAVPSASVPVVNSSSVVYGISSLRYGPTAVVSVVGQLKPLVHGRAGVQRSSSPPPPPLGGGNDGVGSCGSADDHELAATLLQQRRLSHTLASTSGSATSCWDPNFSHAAAAATDRDAAAGWSPRSRNALRRPGKHLTAARAAVLLLRTADQQLFGGAPTSALDRTPTTQLDLPPFPAEEVGRPQTGGNVLHGVQATAAPRRPGKEVQEDDSTAPPHDVVEDLDQFLASGQWNQRQAAPTAGAVPRPPPPPQQQPEIPQVAVSAVSRSQQATQEGPAEELLAGIDQLALLESLRVVHALLPRLSLTQLLRCMETLAAAGYAPSDPWFHDWLLASEQTLQDADATEVYGMLVAMRSLHLRPRSPEWVGAAVAALTANLQQLDAAQAVELLGCFSDMVLQPPEGLLSRVFALLLPDLPQLQPAAVVDFLSSCSRMRVVLPPHVLRAAYDALTPAALAAAPPAQLCRLAAALAALRLQPPLWLLTALVSRADALLRAAVAASGDVPVANDSRIGIMGVGADDGEVGDTGRQDIGTRKLRPRRGKARRAAAAAPAAATPSGISTAKSFEKSTSAHLAGLWSSPSSSRNQVRSASESSPLVVTPAAAALSTTQLSCLLRDLRVLQAPIPPDWGDLCGLFLVLQTGPSTPALQVSYLLGSAARCGLSLPPAAVHVVLSRLEASLRAATEEECRRMQHQHQLQLQLQRPQRRRGALEHAGGAEGAGEGEVAVEAGSAADGDGVGQPQIVTDGATGQWTPQAFSTAVAALLPYKAHLPASLLHTLYDNLHDNLERFDLPELTATLHALPLLAAPPPRRHVRRHASTYAAGDAELPPSPPAALVASYLSCLHGRMHRMQPWQLSMCLFALLRLRARPDPAWMDAFLGQVYRKLPYMNEVQVATVPWVVARMSYRPQAGWVDRLLSAAAGRMSCFSPRHLCQLLWAVGTMGYRPSAAWMARCLDKARLHFRTSDGRTLASLAWAVAELGHSPEPGWLQELCEHLARRLPYMSPRAVANALAAMAALRHRPDADWLDAVLEHVSARLMPLPPGAGSVASRAGDGGCYSLQDLAHVCYSLTRLGCSPSVAWLDAVAAAAARLALQNPAAAAAAAGSSADVGSDGGGAAVGPAAAAAHARHIALLTLALSRLRRRPPPFAWSALLEGFYPCLPYASPQALAVLLAAAATLRLPLPREHAGALLLASHRRMGAFSSRGLAMVFRGFVELGVDPGPRWLCRLEEVLRQDAPRPTNRPPQHHQPEDGDDGQQANAEDEEEEEQGGGWVQQPAGARLSPGERASMLWAAATLESSRPEEPAREAPPRALAHARLRQRPHERHQWAAAAAAADTAADTVADTGAENGVDGYPPPPRWVRKPGPLQRPLRLAGLIAALLPPLQRRTASLRRGLGHLTRGSHAPSGSDGGQTPESDERPKAKALQNDGRTGAQLRHGGLGGASCLRRWKQLTAYSGQDLALLCWAMGRLRLRPRGLLAALLEEVSDRLAATARPHAAAAAPAASGRSGRGPRSTPARSTAAAAPAEEVGAPLPGRSITEATGRGVAEAGVEAIAAQTVGAGRGFTPGEMARVFWGLSSVGIWPTLAWQANAAAAALRMARRGGLSPREQSMLLAALARWRRRRPHARQHPPRPQVRLVASRTAAPAPGSRRGSGRMVRTAAQFSDAAAEKRLRISTTALGMLALAGSAAEMTAPATAPAAAVEGAPVPSQPSTLAAASAVGAAACSGMAPVMPGPQRLSDSRSLATLMWALARLGVVRRLPETWTAAFMPVSLRLLAQLPPSQRVTMLDSLSRMGMRPGEAWLYKAEQVVLQHSGGLTLASSYRALEAALKRMDQVQ